MKPAANHPWKTCAGWRVVKDGRQIVQLSTIARTSTRDRDEIRRRYAAGETQRRLAAEFGVTQQFVSLVVRRLA